MTPEELKLSILKKAFSGTLFGGKEWEDKDVSIFKSLWEITYWDKKFQNVDKTKQKKVIEYKHILAGNFSSLEVENGDVFMLSTGLYKGYTTKTKLGFEPSNGEVISIPGGGSASVKYYKGKFVTADNRIATSKDISLFDNKYIYYFLLSRVKDLEKMYRGTSLKHPDMSLVLEIRIPIPIIEEQKRIVSKVEELLLLIEKYEEAWTRLEKFNSQFPIDMEKSIIKSAINGQLTFQSSDETSTNCFKTKEICHVNDMFFNIPNNWCWVKLNSVCTFKGGFAYKSTDYVEHSNNYLMRLGNVKNNYLVFGDKSCYLPDSLAKKTENFKICEDDILITMTGTRGKGDYFYSKLIDKNDLINKNLYLNQRVGCLRHNNKIIPKYLLFVLQSEFVRNRIFERETGTANQGNIGSNDIMNYIYIPVPPLEEQKRIVAKIEELLPLCNALK